MQKNAKGGVFSIEMLWWAFSAGIPAENAHREAKTHIFVIISETPQVVLKRF